MSGARPLARLILEHSPALVLTGAGVSTESRFAVMVTRIAEPSSLNGSR
jgi:hypothetical protein